MDFGLPAEKATDNQGKSPIRPLGECIRQKGQIHSSKGQIDLPKGRTNTTHSNSVYSNTQPNPTQPVYNNVQKGNGQVRSGQVNAIADNESKAVTDGEAMNIVSAYGKLITKEQAMALLAHYRKTDARVEGWEDILGNIYRNVTAKGRTVDLYRLPYSYYHKYGYADKEYGDGENPSLLIAGIQPKKDTIKHVDVEEKSREEAALIKQLVLDDRGAVVLTRK